MVAGRIGDGNTVGTMVRMPSDLRDRIKAAADKSGRSMNSEIVATLEQAYPAPSSWEYDPELVQSLLDEMGALLSQHDSGATSEVREAIDRRFEVLRAQVREHLDAPSPDFIILNRTTGEEIPVELKQTVGRGLRLQKPNKGHTTAVEPRTEKPTPRQLKRPPKK